MNVSLSRLSGFLVLTLVAVALAPTISFTAARGADAQAQAVADSQGEINAELIGQVYNASPQMSAQYGYITYLKGLPTSAITAPSRPLSETTALLTFYSHTLTERVINNGPMRVIDRTGEVTFYFTATPHGDFTRPDTLRVGTPLMVAALRHQVLLDTQTGAFTTRFDCTIARNEEFTIAGATYSLGVPGQHFELTISGQVNPQGVPSAYIAGYVTGLELQPAGK
jgi:hypothetical protein